MSPRTAGKGAYKFPWRQNGHTSEGIENQQVVVTAHHADGATAHRKLEKLVVRGITAFCQSFCYVNHFCVTDESR